MFEHLTDYVDGNNIKKEVAYWEQLKIAGHSFKVLQQSAEFRYIFDKYLCNDYYKYISQKWNVSGDKALLKEMKFLLLLEDLFGTLSNLEQIATEKLNDLNFIERSIDADE